MATSTVDRHVLNRTLLQRQHLLERVSMSPLDMVEHLLGLQAQDVLPPYLSLFARIDGFAPEELSRALEEREAVRLLVMRGTIHLMTGRDAAPLRAFTQSLLTRSIGTASWGKGFPKEQYAVLAARTRRLLADGPLPARRLGEALAQTWPDRSPSDCVNIAKSLVPLVQLPPRGMWGRSGGQVYDTLESVLGGPPVVEPGERPPLVEPGERQRARVETPAPAQGSDPTRLDPPGPDVQELVRRYLRAFGPATPADVTAWSGVTGMKAAFTALADELVRLGGEDGRPLWDLGGLELADPDVPAPVRLLGTYDNVWLSHAGRDRVTTPEARARWMGSNGGLGAVVLAGGWLAGLWRRTDGGKLDLELFRTLTRAEQSELDAEVGAVEELLAR